MRFIGIATYEPLKEDPEIGDIIIVDYTRKGIVPDDFLTYGHGRNQYVCETTGKGSGGFIQLKVLYDLNRNTPRRVGAAIYKLAIRAASRGRPGSRAPAVANAAYLPR